MGDIYGVCDSCAIELNRNAESLYRVKLEGLAEDIIRFIHFLWWGYVAD